MKIGLVLASVPGYSETFINSKIKGLKAAGYEIMLFTGNGSREFDLCEVHFLPKRHATWLFQGLNVFWVYMGLLLHLRNVIKFYRLERQSKTGREEILKRIYFNAPILKTKLDWLHFGFGTLALGREYLAKTIGAKLAVSFRGFDIGVYPIKNPNCYMTLWDNVDKIHVISNDIKDLVYLNGFKDQASIVKITPAIDVGLFSKSISNSMQEPKQILTVARLHWKKGLDYTLRALALLKQAGFDFQYTIVGIGEHYEYLVYLSRLLGINDRVRFIGKQSPLEIRNHMQHSDIYIQYSVQEGFCNAVLEAQAMGLLCVVSNAEGLDENVLDDETGWVVPKRQPEALASKLMDILQLPEAKTMTVRQQAVARVQQEFHVQAHHRAFQRFYSN